MGATNENRSKRKHQKNPCHMFRILFNGIEHQILCQNRRTLSGRGDRSGTFNTKSSGHVFTYYHSIYHCQHTAQCDTGVYRFSIHW